MIKNKNKESIEPLYVKDEKGKKISVYRSIDDYKFIIKKVKEFEEIKKDLKRASSKKKNLKKN